MDKQRRRLQPREVLSTELLRLARRVQRIGEQQQRIGDGGVLGSEECSLPSAVRVPAEDDEFRRDLTYRFGGALQSFAIARGCAWERRTRGTCLAIGKIAAQNVKPSAGELLRHGAQ